MKLTKDFECVPDGEIYPRVLKAGEECPPSLVGSAAALGVINAKDVAKAEEATKAEADRLAAEEAAKGAKA